VIDKDIISHMLQPVNPHDAVAFGRLKEFFSPTPPWNRSLWSIGLILGLRELHEASAVLQSGTLSEPSVRRICSSLQRKIGKDPALAHTERNHLRAQMSSVPKADGPAHHTIQQMTEILDGGYLRRWSSVVAKPEFTVELFARSVASHVLDAGFSAQHIHGILKGKVRAGEPVTLSDICEELHGEMARSPTRPFKVLLAFSRSPKLANGIPTDWLRGEAVTNWLTQRGFDTAEIRAQVALLLTVHARDAAGAALVAREAADRFAARTRIATGEVLARVPVVWVEGETLPFPLTGESRGVRVKELDREARIFSMSTSDDSVEAALELMAHLEDSSPPAAIAGGWGAIEGLLADPGDRATAADNLAALVACSFPRQELTSLAFRASREHDTISTALAGQSTNRQRSLVIAELIRDGKMPQLRATADRAAVARVGKVLSDPSAELQTIKESIAETFHRLYRQRNLILHGGRLNSVTLKASLRTVSKLAGAGMDRITHGHYVQSMRPLELVARANLSIALIKKETAMACVDLLEHV
jgi:hypothetical protein